MPYRLHRALVFLLAGIGLAAAAAPARAQKPPRTADVVAPGVGEKLDAYMSDPERFPEGYCGSVLVAVDGRELLAKGYGMANARTGQPNTADTLWDWCSVTKQFTAAAVLRLEMRRKLRIDDSLRKHFPKAPKDKAKVTIRHLLSHTSSMQSDPGLGRVNLLDRRACEKFILGVSMGPEPPGTHWEYSNMAYFLLAALIEEKSGKSYEDFLYRELFKLAGMKGAGCIGDRHVDYDRVAYEDRGRSSKQLAYGPRLSWGYRGAGGVLASVRDMLAWDRALRGNKLLNAAAKRELFEPVKNGYALGWFVGRTPDGLEVAHHSGHTGTLVTFFLRGLEKDVVVALACSYELEEHPQRTAFALASMARR